MLKPSQTQLKDLLTRRVDKIIGEKELRAKLTSGRKLRIKHGVDPTTPDLHLGYSVVYHKLREFQELGHTVVYVIGDFTARFGDPTGKEKTRQLRDAREVKKMAEHYIRQALTILDPKKTEIRYNGEWLDKLSAEDLIRLMGHFTYAQMIERDMFQRRMKAHQEIGFHEPVYPMLQGYDSVALKSDLELGGTDQKFNLLVGRELQKEYGQEPQCILTMPLLVGLDGVEKMSKSKGNYVGISEAPNEMFGKLMSISDDLMWTYYTLLSFRPLAEIDLMKQEIALGRNPRDCKVMLAQEIVARFHSQADAERALEDFNHRARGGVPDDIPQIELSGAPLGIAQLLKQAGLCPSTSDANRNIEQGGVKIDGTVISDKGLKVDAGTFVMQVGKRRFARVVLK